MISGRPYRDDADRDRTPRFLSEAGAETAIMLTNVNNAAAISLYKSAGFSIADTEYAYTCA